MNNREIPISYNVLYRDCKNFFEISEVSRCFLCHEPTCTKACPDKENVGDILRSIYLENYIGAMKKAIGSKCATCDAFCEKACVLSKGSMPVGIKEIMLGLNKGEEYLPVNPLEEIDMSMEICGIKLENPFLLSSSVVASSYDMCKRAFEAGWAGASFKTICSFRQHEASPRFASIKKHSNSFFGFKNIEQLSDHSVEENIEVFRKLRKEFPHKVIIASIMGRNEEEWTYLAEKCEEAGASVIECNFSCPNMENDELGITIGQSEELVERFTKAVRKGTSLPILAKLTPNITDMVPIAIAARRGGADGIAAINTINSITGVDVDSIVAEPNVEGKSIIGGYSGTAVKPIALRFISELSNEAELASMHISGMGGIETWSDALEYILLGAGSLQITTAVMQYGYRIIDDLLEGLSDYMKYKNIPRLQDIIGGASKTVVNHQGIERDTILFPVFDKDKCIGCGRCYIACQDGGHQAIEFDPDIRKPKLRGDKCVGCHLCRMVCNLDAIDVARRRRVAV